MPNALNLKKGSVYGKLTIISEPIIYTTKKGNPKGYKYNCICECGNVSSYYASSLNKGISRLCSDCSNIKKRTVVINNGDVFGYLKVIDLDFLEIEEGKLKTKIRCYKCECSCGDVSFYRQPHLVSGRKNKCNNCAFKNRPQCLKNKKTDLQKLYESSIIGRCLKDGGRIKNSLSIDDFEKIIKQNCYYCNDEPKLIFYSTKKNIIRLNIVANGIDRVDSENHYTIDNCVPCCKVCNYMKRNTPLYEFKSHIEKIYNNIKNKKNE